MHPDQPGRIAESFHKAGTTTEAIAAIVVAKTSLNVSLSISSKLDGLAGHMAVVFSAPQELLTQIVTRLQIETASVPLMN